MEGTQEMYSYLFNLLDSESDSDYDADIILHYETIHKKKFSKKDYVKRRRPRREFTLQDEFLDEDYKNYYRITHAQFTEVHDFIKHEIEGVGCNASKPIETKEKLAVFLRYLASGNSFKSIGFTYKMGDRTVSKIIEEAAEAIWKCMQPLYMPQPTTEQWTSIARGFEETWQFPHCIGAIDGRHIVLKKPSKNRSSLKLKHASSVVLMAIVDSNNRFVIIDVGPMGGFNDRNIFSNSDLAEKMKNGTLNIPPASPIPTITEPVPYVFLGNEAFPLSENVMRPHPPRNVTDSYKKKVFNYRLSRARQPAECTFDMLTSRFVVFQSPFECKPSTVVKIVKACCVLYNYLQESQVSQTEDECIEPHLSQHKLYRLHITNSRSAAQAISVRQNLTEYFNSPLGLLPGQKECVLNGKC